MPVHLRLRFWAEAILGAAAGALAAITVFWHDWIEAVFRFDPDHGGGAAEWAIVAVLLTAAVMLGLAARAEWRRAALQQA